MSRIETVGDITLDRQQASETCEHCGGAVAVTRGSAYDDGRPFGLYLAGMHRCGAGEPTVILAIALASPDGGRPQAVHLQVAATADAFEMWFIEPTASPWRTHAYLGRMLTPAEARASAQRGRFFLVADRVVADVPEVQSFLSRTDSS